MVVNGVCILRNTCVLGRYGEACSTTQPDICFHGNLVARLSGILGMKGCLVVVAMCLLSCVAAFCPVCYGVTMLCGLFLDVYLRL